MLSQEKELFIELCKFKNQNTEMLKSLIYKNSTACVLGELFFNRMQGIAYAVLLKNDLLGYANREFRNSLRHAYIHNIMLNADYLCCIEKVTNILSQCTDKYAMLKGALLCNLYPEGYRTSNDIDILVNPTDVTTIGTALANAGFIQGNIRNSKFIPASRKDIIESKMLRGETVPYILKVNMPVMKYLEVDINFSLDYKNGDTNAVDSMLSHSIEAKVGKTKIRTLDEEDFLIHLCCHLYKEATTLPWIKMNRDMTLYKFVDIYYILLERFNNHNADQLMQRAEELGVLDICCCVIKWVCDLFDIENIQIKVIAEYNLRNNESILHKVIFPSEKKTYHYTVKDIKERFFTKNRILILEESNDAKT